MIVAVDTETTGLDFWHGTRPFFVSTCEEGADGQRYWEWSVDPRTRRVNVNPDDVDEIAEYLDAADRIVWHNGKFDLHALRTVGVWNRIDWRRVWAKSDDTIYMAHVLESNRPRNLTDLVIRWLGVDLEAYEKRIDEAAQKARRVASAKAFREEHGEYALAKPGRPDMPSAKGEKSYKADLWLPRELWRRVDDVREEHPDWETDLRDYALADTAGTLHLGRVLLEEIRRRRQERNYRQQLKMTDVLYAMERDGVTYSPSRASELKRSHVASSAKAEAECVSIAKTRGIDLVMPKSGRNKALDALMFDEFKVEKIVAKKSKTGIPSLDKDVLRYYSQTLDGDAKRFVDSLLRKRKDDTVVSYLDGYARFSTRGPNGTTVIHSSVNPTGTGTLRCSSSNPNGQNIGKTKDEEGRSLKYPFGPAPGREWWAMDYENIELRIPAYVAGEEEMIALFERPDDPPYFGSNHLLVAHILWPREFEECLRTGESFKDKYKATLYQWTKNGNFAAQYGAIPESGTADRAYHQEGAQEQIMRRFAKIAAYNRWCIEHANRHGFVEAIPDRTVDPDRGYSISLDRYEGGRVRPTEPLNYVIQSSAMQATRKAQVRCQERLDEWNEANSKANYRQAIQVHDEIVFDFPAGGRRNLPKVNALRRLMEESGRDIGVPLKVSVGYHPVSWADEVKY